MVWSYLGNPGAPFGGPSGALWDQNGVRKWPAGTPGRAPRGANTIPQDGSRPGYSYRNINDFEGVPEWCPGGTEKDPKIPKNGSAK